MSESFDNGKAPMTIKLWEAGIYNLVTVKKTTKKDLIDVTKLIWSGELEDTLKELGCDNNILEQVKELIKKHDLFTIHTSIIQDSNVLSIVIKCSITYWVKLIILKKTEYYSINIKTGERELKYWFSISGEKFQKEY